MSNTNQNVTINDSDEETNDTDNLYTFGEEHKNTFFNR
jgi:hypothetical protein